MASVFLFPMLVSADDLPQIRKEYYAAVNDEKAADRFYQKLKKQNLSEPLLLAYFGSAQAIRARHAINPYNKVSFLRAGMKTLNSAVAKDSENLEIRYLRFSLEHYIPSFLGYSKHLESDRKKIVELSKQRKFGSMDKVLLVSLLNFMKETKRCSPQEIATLDQAINNG
jgi:hypothetical protein